MTLAHKRIVFRVDSSSEIGLGHARRCLTLAQELHKRGVIVDFVSRNLPGSLNSEIQCAGFALHYLPSTSIREANEPIQYDWALDARSTSAICKNIEPIDWLIVDHYQLDSRWEDKLRHVTKRLMAIDDLANRKHNVELLLDQNFIDGYLERYKELVPAECGLCLGVRYALLQPQYMEARKSLVTRHDPRDSWRVLVYFGGADAFGLTTMAAEVLQLIFANRAQIDVILPEDNPQWRRLQAMAEANPLLRVHNSAPTLATLLSKVDFAIGACGTTTWERFCMGVPSFVLTLAPNQIRVAESLSQQNLIRWIGDVNNSTLTALKAKLASELNGVFKFGIASDWSSACLRLVDGAGAARVATALLAGASTPLQVRRANINDVSVLLEWANDWVTRKNAFSTSQINIETHHAWFQSKLNNFPKSQLFIVEVAEGVPIGQVRFEVSGEEFELHYALASAFRGRRLGGPMLEAAIQTFRTTEPDATIFGKVKSDNPRSSKVLQSLGFLETSRDSVSIKYSMHSAHPIGG